MLLYINGQKPTLLKVQKLKLKLEKEKALRKRREFELEVLLKKKISKKLGCMAPIEYRNHTSRCT
jgi:hypothetical protein